MFVKLAVRQVGVVKTQSTHQHFVAKHTRTTSEPRGENLSYALKVREGGLCRWTGALLEIGFSFFFPHYDGSLLVVRTMCSHTVSGFA